MMRRVSDIALARQKGLIVTAGEDGVSKIWRIEDGELVQKEAPEGTATV
jgi:hypothetical protein